MGEQKNLHLRISLSIHLRSSQIRIIYMSTPKWRRYKPNRQPTHHKCDGMNHNLFISAFSYYCYCCYSAIFAVKLLWSSRAAVVMMFFVTWDNNWTYLFPTSRSHFQPATEISTYGWVEFTLSQSIEQCVQSECRMTRGSPPSPASLCFAKPTEVSDESVAQSIIMANNWNWYRYWGGGGDRDQQANGNLNNLQLLVPTPQHSVSIVFVSGVLLPTARPFNFRRITSLLNLLFHRIWSVCAMELALSKQSDQRGRGWAGELFQTTLFAYHMNKLRFLYIFLYSPHSRWVQPERKCKYARWLFISLFAKITISYAVEQNVFGRFAKMFT